MNSNGMALLRREEAGNRECVDRCAQVHTPEMVRECEMHRGEALASRPSHHGVEVPTTLRKRHVGMGEQVLMQLRQPYGAVGIVRSERSRIVPRIEAPQVDAQLVRQLCFAENDPAHVPPAPIHRFDREFLEHSRFAQIRAEFERNREFLRAAVLNLEGEQDIRRHHDRFAAHGRRATAECRGDRDRLAQREKRKLLPRVEHAVTPVREPEQSRFASGQCVADSPRSAVLRAGRQTGRRHIADGQPRDIVGTNALASSLCDILFRRTRPTLSAHGCRKVKVTIALSYRRRYNYTVQLGWTITRSIKIEHRQRSTPCGARGLGMCQTKRYTLVCQVILSNITEIYNLTNPNTPAAINGKS